MRWCWEMDPDKRPSFSTLVQTISKILEDKAGYLHVCPPIAKKQRQIGKAIVSSFSHTLLM